MEPASNPEKNLMADENNPNHAPEKSKKRGEWANKLEFVLAIVGEIIGLGNVWRFPYLCFKNGGGVFLVPYALILFTCGIPIFFLEISLGQMSGQGGITCWKKLSPLFEGLGYGSQVLLLYTMIYYIIIMAWAFLYLFSTFHAVLPWATCNNTWNTGTHFVCLEGLITSISDMYPSFFFTGHRRKILLLVICTVSFLIGLFMVTEGGLYVFQLFDYYACSGIPLLVFSILEAVSVGWAYGPDRYYDNITNMIGYRPAPYMKYCWKFITPCIFTGVLIFSLARFTPLRYNNSYHYPWWGHALGLFMSLSSVLVAPLWSLYRLAVTPGTLRQRLKVLTTPADDLLRTPPKTPLSSETCPSLPLNNTNGVI